MATVRTIGHSTRDIGPFLALLREAGVDLVVDVRRYPMSRRFPQFRKEALEGALARAGIDYRHEEPLGGRRTPVGGSRNAAWRSRGFRAYADHMGSSGFREALARLEEDARDRAPAIMCAEIVPWRCHRQLISDVLVARGHEVVHLIEPGETRRHELSRHARVLPGGRIAYPAPADPQLDLLEED